MASAAAPCRTCSASSSPSFHPSPAPSSPTPSTSSESRKRKRDEVTAKPRPFLITPPHSEDGAPVGARPRRMFTIPMFTSLWQSLKSLAGVGSAPPDSSPGGDEDVAGSPKRVRVEGTEDPSKGDDSTPNVDPNKEPIASTAQPIPSIPPIQSQSSNKESPPPQTQNNRPSLKIKAPATTDKQTPPTQLPSPLASSSGDELATVFKKTTTARPVQSLPPIMADPLAPPFFTRPLRKRSNPEAVLLRILARRAAFGPAYPPSREARGGYPPTQIPRHRAQKIIPGLNGEIRREGHPYYPLLRRLPTGAPPGVLDKFKTHLKYPDNKSSLPLPRPNERQRYTGRVEKYMRKTYQKNRHLDQLSQIELAVILEQLNKEKYSGFQTLEQVEQARRERNIEIAKLRDAARKELIPNLDPESLARFNTIVRDLRNPAVPGDRLYNTMDGFLANKAALVRILWQEGSISMNWLNDEGMNFYVAMIAKRGNIEGEPKKILSFNNAFWVNLVRGASVARWATRQKVGGRLMFNLDYMIFPCNHGGTHWTMCVVNFKKKRIENYDSMYSRATADQVFRLTREYLIAETKSDLDGWTNYNHWNTVQQGNAADCGMFSLKAAEVATRGAVCNVTQEDMPVLRQRMIVEMATRTLFPPQYAP
ncbi:uncharacterized protein LAJ45_01356 [Morchella importuna]|uniref:uncharacterized protein n=1 Tax=Morchella importuna TaxID=1174673 RepID=UPI001E8DDDCA|nr:uncharacterized protein LAJ45_01356 [Morchella importuna]KAH8154825.1 hypothetical protein LAJ45_01356 [Morchella importuna]